VVEGDGGRGDRREPGHWVRARRAPRRARTHRGAHRAGRPPLREHGLAVLFRRRVSRVAPRRRRRPRHPGTVHYLPLVQFSDKFCTNLARKERKLINSWTSHLLLLPMNGGHVALLRTRVRGFPALVQSHAALLQPAFTTLLLPRPGPARTLATTRIKASRLPSASRLKEKRRARQATCAHRMVPGAVHLLGCSATIGS
jgi:hypothetical protein